jgi:hypothetical protein
VLVEDQIVACIEIFAALLTQNYDQMIYFLGNVGFTLLTKISFAVVYQDINKSPPQELTKNSSVQHICQYNSSIYAHAIAVYQSEV